MSCNCPCWLRYQSPCCATPPDPQSDPRPIDLRDDRPYRNLSEVHHAGAEGLAATFPIGSLWEIGPFVHGRDPEVVRITGAPYTDPAGKLINYSARPEDADAKGKPSWFIETEVLWTPGLISRVGYNVGQPPHVLCALTPQMAVKAGLFCAPVGCRACQRGAQRVAELERQLTEARAHAELAAELAAEKSRAITARYQTLKAENLALKKAAVRVRQGLYDANLLLNDARAEFKDLI